MDGSENVGQGFIADGYFITAAHVINDNPRSYINLNGANVKLSELEPIMKGEGEVDRDPYQIDAAVYKVKSVNSFLHLSSYKPQTSDLLRNFCIFPKFYFGRYSNELSVEDALLLDGESEEGNYFYCKCNRNRGSSGSPLLKGTEVVGIMHGGDKSQKLCSFLRTSALLFPNINTYLNPQKIIERLFPYGCDKIMAIVILHYMNCNISINLEEEGIDETGYYAILDRLPFKPYDLTSEERDILTDYCNSFV